jgi:hypothetical protein
MSIEVWHLHIAHSLAHSSTKHELNPYNGTYGESVFVPPVFTHGVCLELFQE